MANKIRVALLGLGDIGEGFAEHFLEIIQEKNRPVVIVAVAHDDLESPTALGFQQNGVPVYQKATDVLKLGKDVDVIFDLTGDPKTRKALRKGLMDSKNNHTIIAPEMIAKLIWMFFDEKADLDDVMHGGY